MSVLSTVFSLGKSALGVATGGTSSLLVPGLALVAGIAIGGTGAYKVQQWRYTSQIETINAAWADEKAKLAEATATEIARRQIIIEQQQSQIAAADQKHSKELENARAESERLRSDVDAGNQRLSIAITTAGGAASGVATGKTPTSASMGNGAPAGRAFLDRATANALIAIAAAGDKAIIQLKACQDYVRTVVTAPVSHE